MGDTLLSLGKERKALGLPHRGDGTDFVDFPGEFLPSLRSGWGRRGEGEREERREEEI